MSAYPSCSRSESRITISSETPLTQPDHEVRGNRAAISLLQNLLQALDYANTDMIDLSLLRWQNMTADEKSFVPPTITSFLESLSHQSESQKYFYAEQNRQLVRTGFQELNSTT
ncbi:MAG: hypothetical protein ACHQUC_06200 [Chlamydiales bacterium]